MHKKLEADLMSLAHRVLQLKTKEDVFALKEMAQQLHEKLTMLAFVETYVNTTPQLQTSKEDLVKDVAAGFEKKEQDKTINTPDVPEITEQPFDELTELLDPNTAASTTDTSTKAAEDLPTLAELKKELAEDNAPILDFKDDPQDVGFKNEPTLEDELKDTIPVDVMANLFEKVPSKSLNDVLQKSISIDLNDRIAFVKHLFNGSQEDYNRVVSQLNTFKTEKEAKRFITKMVKPDYNNWQNQEALELRFISLIEKKFV
jgi:hypothetical protein